MNPENKNTQPLEILEEARKNAAALAEILFSIGEMVSGGSEISGDTITVLGELARDVREEIEMSQLCME